MMEFCRCRDAKMSAAAEGAGTEASRRNAGTKFEADCSVSQWGVWLRSAIFFLRLQFSDESTATSWLNLTHLRCAALRLAWSLWWKQMQKWE
jgi:hypothetical protein